MGHVRQLLERVLAKQVDEHGLVVWYDPDGFYRETLDGLQIPETTIRCYDGSFYELRHEIEPLMSGSEAPRLILYVPLAPAETHQALAEVEAAGVVVKPGQQPPTRNTRPAIIARHALQDHLGKDSTANIEKQIEAGKLALEDLEALADRGRDVTRGVVNVVFGTGNPEEIALMFLAQDVADDAIEAKDAGGELQELLRAEFGMPSADERSLEALRQDLARHVLVADFRSGFAGEPPSSLSSLPHPESRAAAEACVDLAHTWRRRSDYRQSYAAHAERVEGELGLADLALERPQIEALETFPMVEQRLQDAVEDELLQAPTREATELAERRQSSFWAELRPNLQARWGLLATIGALLVEADRVEAELNGANGDVAALLASYTASERPWSRLDTQHRHMESRYHSLEMDVERDDQTLERLIARARQRYTEVASALSERFIYAYEAAAFAVPRTRHQTRIFADLVAPHLETAKVAYVWVDALRYEMGHELAKSLGEDLEVGLEPAVAAVPTTTEVGMAALLPRADRGALAVAKGRHLGFEIDGTRIEGRADRVAFLKDNAGVDVVDVKLEDLLPRPKQRTAEGIEDAELILVTSQEIDAIGEDEGFMARRTMDALLHELQRACRVLTDLGVGRIVLTADHGHLFGEELSEAMKLDPPGGQTIELRRRVWIGYGGSRNPALLRTDLANLFSVASDHESTGETLELATPWNYACFKKAGGASAYFHGGLSPQELIVPVLEITQPGDRASGATGRLSWSLTPGSETISTRFVSVQIAAEAAELFDVTPPRVRLEIRAGGTPISRPISASYGFDDGTGNVQLRLDEANPRRIAPNTVTLMITEASSAASVSVHLLDATTGVELARLDEIEMAISL
ncbi:MAG: PglZ domain-containing protein [Candidatus Bipolaricaulia bacterium]